MAEARAPAGAGHPVLWGGRNTVPSSQDHLAVVHADWVISISGACLSILKN